MWYLQEHVEYVQHNKLKKHLFYVETEMHFEMSEFIMSGKVLEHKNYCAAQKVCTCSV